MLTARGARPGGERVHEDRPVALPFDVRQEAAQVERLGMSRSAIIAAHCRFAVPERTIHLGILGRVASKTGSVAPTPLRAGEIAAPSPVVTI
jgi:hypothetical protein